MRRDDSETGPRALYESRLRERRQAVTASDRLELRFSVARAAIFLAGAALVWPALFARSVGVGWLALPVFAFAVLAYRHDRVIRRRRRLERSVQFYEHGLARLDDRWSGTGPTGESWFEPDHPYAGDLDLHGQGSLFQLLCAARTRIGERTLARWLATPASPVEIERRQRAIAELRDRLDVRERLAILGEETGASIDDERLSAWAAAPPELTGRGLVLWAALLGGANVAALLLWLVSPIGNPVLLATFAAGLSFAWTLRARVLRVLGRVERPEKDLEGLCLVLSALEVERFESPLLSELHAALFTGGRPASRHIAGLARLVQLRDSRENALFRPWSALVLYGTQVAHAMERWRSRSGAAVADWLRAAGEIEALSSLAQFSFEHPEQPFPEITTAGPRFEGLELGHPLLARSRCVGNDVRLDAQQQLLLVSGSNMSGKSTLLRTVGVNAVLAFAGGTVQARSLVISPLAVGACIHVVDSLQEGTSRFYAEIRRLRTIIGLGSAERPVLFLLDEILHGTNSHDRRIGAEAVIRSLLARGAVGLVTTHDLALASIAEALSPRARNVHFEDRLEGQRILFDYKLRDGLVRRGNALELMRAVGLDV